MTISARVDDLLKLAGYSTKTRSLQPDYHGLRVEAVKTASTGLISKTITCLENDEDLHRFLKFSLPDKASWIVIPDRHRARVTPGARSIIERRKLDVLTLTLFYDRMLRARDICGRTIDTKIRWKDEEIGLHRLSELYVPQPAQIEWDSQSNSVDDSNKYVSEAFSKPAGAVIFILADAGRGKTWSTWSLAHDMATKYLNALPNGDLPEGPLPPIPFLIPFSEYKRLTSFDGIVLERLNGFGTLDIRAEGFKHLLSLGRILLILDGFDEMLELAPAHARENLVEIRRHLRGQSKLVLTSRRTLFPTNASIAELLQAPAGERNGLSLSVCNLRGFTEPQLWAFHRARGASDDEVSRILRLPFNKELQSYPQIAEYFLEIIRRKIEPKQSEVYGTILSLIYSRESGKWEKASAPPMPSNLQESFLTEISLLMWPGGSIDRELAQSEAERLGHPYLSKHHLLQPTLDGQLQFEHHVWRDWFLARALVGRLEKHSWVSSALSDYLRDPLPEYCASFLANEISLRRLTEGLRDRNISAAAFCNLLRMAIRQIHADGSRADRARELAELLGSTKALGYKTLSKINFQMFDLRNWTFDGTTLDTVRFDFCTLPRAFEETLSADQNTRIADCDWWPPEEPATGARKEARERVENALRKFIWSLEPLRVRNEISKEEMGRDFHVHEKDKGLRCLMKTGYVRTELRKRTEEYYLLQTDRLDQLVRFLATGEGLEDAMRCASS